MATERTRASISNPDLARPLPGLCYQTGFKSVRVEPTMSFVRDFTFVERAGNVTYQLNKLVEDARLTRKIADDWLAAQWQLSKDGNFLSMLITPNVARRIWPCSR